MAERIEVFRSTVGAFSTATPSFTFSVPNGEVVGLDVVFPRGCNNLVTVNVLYSGSIVIPKTPGALLAGNGKIYSFELEGFPTGQGWQAGINNADTDYAHTIEFHFKVDELSVFDDGLFPPIILMPRVTAV